MCWNLEALIFYSIVDLSQAGSLLSDLNQLIKKQKDENSQLQIKLGTNPAEINGMLI